jgi:hypothetical protein
MASLGLAWLCMALHGIAQLWPLHGFGFGSSPGFGLDSAWLRFSLAWLELAWLQWA